MRTLGLCILWFIATVAAVIVGVFGFFFIAGKASAKQETTETPA
jgi:uncharacterized protein YneF (UPF0154 family)